MGMFRACLFTLLFPCLFVFLCSFMFILPVLAEDIKIEPQQVIFNSRELAVVQPSFDELWIVANNLPEDENEWKKLSGVKEIESLDVQGAEGIKLTFHRSMDWKITSPQKDIFIMQRGKITSKNSILSLKNELIFNDKAGKIVRVYSRKTGKRMQIMLAKNQQHYTFSGDFGGPVFVPSVIGAAFAEDTGIMPKGKMLAVTPRPKAVPSVQIEVADIKESTAIPPHQVRKQAKKFSKNNIQQPHNLESEIEFTLPEDYVAKKEGVSNNRQRNFVSAYGALEGATQHISGLFPVSVEDEAKEVTEEDIASNPTSALRKDEIFLLKLNRRDKGEYHPLLHKRYKSLIKAESGSQQIQARMSLARFYIAFSRYDQAEGELMLLPLGKDGWPKFTLPRTLLGAVLVLQGRGEEAMNLLQNTQGEEPHRTIWLAAAETLAGEYVKAVHHFEGKLKQVTLYPEHIYEKLLITEGRALLGSQRYAELFEKMDVVSLRNPDKTMPREAKYFVAKANLELGQTERGRQLLAEVSEGMEDKLAVQSKRDFVLDLARTEDLGTKQLIMFLEDLRYMWRGDELEGDMLKELGKRYTQTRDYRLALNRYKTYAVAFPEEKDIEKITEKMRDTFIEVFQPANMMAMDKLGLLGMYYDFRELTPADRRGDVVVEDVGEVLGNSVLYSRAIDLFERQLEFRTTNPAKQAIMGAELAGMYRKKGDYAKAVKVLRKWTEKENLPTNIKRQVDIEKARVFLGRNRYKEACEILSGWLDDTVRQVQVDIAWQAEDYATVARLLSQMFDTEEHSGFENIRTRSDFVRLSYALVQMEQGEALTQLIKNYKRDLKENPEMADVVNVYATKLRLKADDLVLTAGRPLQRIAKQLLSLNDFEERYVNLHKTIEARKRRREIYNNKIQYMDHMRANGMI